MKSKLFLSLLLLSVVGCGKIEPSSDIDQCKRIELFQQCMAKLPVGPTSVGSSNDWDEVVDACEKTAYYQSFRNPKFIKAECRSRE